MEETMRQAKSLSNCSQRRSEFVDDECSTDSGCSSGGSAGSVEHLLRCRNGTQESLSSHTPSGHYHRHVHGYHCNESKTTRSQERLSRSKIRETQRCQAIKISRSLSPCDTRCNIKESSSYSSSPSDNTSIDSDSLKSVRKTEILRRALKCLKLGNWENNSGKEKNLTKKNPKRILREPVSYTYVRGLSGLPTQRIPRNIIQQLGVPCSCQDIHGLYRKNPDRR